jgi:hypothetical protein
MPSVGLDLGADDWRILLEVLGRLHRQLQVKTEELQGVLQYSADPWTACDDVQGYLAQMGPAQLGTAERAELTENVRQQFQMLERLTAHLDQLQALVAPGGKPGSEDR